MLCVGSVQPIRQGDQNDTFANSPDTSVVTVTSPVTTARNPGFVVPLFDTNLTAMYVPVKAPGLGPQCLLFGGWGDEEDPPKM